MKIVKKKKFLRPSMATSEQTQSLTDQQLRSQSGRRRTVRKRKRRSPPAESPEEPVNPRIARNDPLETLSCEQRAARLVHAALQVAAVLAAVGVAYLAYRGIRSGSGGAWVGVLGSLALLAVAMFSLKKMNEPSDWDPAHLRARGEKPRRRRSRTPSVEE
jgi:hypothetical protein